MEREKPYTISKGYDKTTHEEFWYCHMVGFAYIPVMGSIGTKKHAKAFCDMYNKSIGR